MSYNKYWLAFLNLFYPHRCLSCKTALPFDDPKHLCLPCWNSIAPVKDPLCKACGIHLKDGGSLCFHCKNEKLNFSVLRSASVYEGALKEMVRRFKYNGKNYLAEELSIFLYEAWKRFPEISGSEVILPIPLYSGKERERGYNQAELLAQGLLARINSHSHSSHVPLPRLNSDAVRRVRNTASQTGLPREKRLVNVGQAFQVRLPESIRSKCVLLIDDVCTTGATLNECARVLMENGAKEVNALVLARD